MSEETKVVAEMQINKNKETTSEPEESVIAILMNEPEVVTYYEQKGKEKVKKEIEVSRMTFRTIELAFAPIVKIVSLADTTGSITASALFGLSSKDFEAIREVLVSCVNISSAQFAKLPISIVTPVLEAFLRVNREEIVAFAKGFLKIGQEMRKYQESLTPLLPKKANEEQEKKE